MVMSEVETNNLLSLSHYSYPVKTLSRLQSTPNCPGPPEWWVNLSWARRRCFVFQELRAAPIARFRAVDYTRHKATARLSDATPLRTEMWCQTSFPISCIHELFSAATN